MCVQDGLERVVFEWLKSQDRVRARANALIAEPPAGAVTVVAQGPGRQIALCVPTWRVCKRRGNGA